LLIPIQAKTTVWAERSHLARPRAVAVILESEQLNSGITIRIGQKLMAKY